MNFRIVAMDSSVEDVDYISLKGLVVEIIAWRDRGFPGKMVLGSHGGSICLSLRNSWIRGIQKKNDLTTSLLAEVEGRLTILRTEFGSLILGGCFFVFVWEIHP